MDAILLIILLVLLLLVIFILSLTADANPSAGVVSTLAGAGAGAGIVAELEVIESLELWSNFIRFDFGSSIGMDNDAKVEDKDESPPSADREALVDASVVSIDVDVDADVGIDVVESVEFVVLLPPLVTV